MIIRLRNISKESPYYEALKKGFEKNNPTPFQWKILKIRLGVFYYALQTILLYVKLKKKFKSILVDSPKKSKRQ